MEPSAIIGYISFAIGALLMLGGGVYLRIKSYKIDDTDDIADIKAFHLKNTDINSASTRVVISLPPKAHNTASNARAQQRHVSFHDKQDLSIIGNEYHSESCMQET